MMGLKKTVKKLIPAYRLHNTMMERLNALDEKNEYLFWLSQSCDGETMEETKKRVFMKLPKATGDMRLIQLCNNFILQRIKKICKKNDIDFFLDSGTLLGAVRHGGFIPWDDDIDIAMFSDDYARFVSVMKDESDLEVHNCYSYQHKSFVRKVKLKDCPFLFVDIFLMERLDCRIVDEDEFFAKTQQQCRMFHNELYEAMKKCQSLNKHILVPQENADLDPILEQLVVKYRNSLPVGKGGYLCSAVDDWVSFREEKRILQYEIYCPYKKAIFEGEEYNIPNDVDFVLQRHYGDYYSFPHTISSYHSNEISCHMNEIRIVADRLGIK